VAFGAADLPAAQRPRSDGGSIAKEEVYRAFIHSVSHSSVNELLMRDGALCDSVAIPRATICQAYILQLANADLAFPRRT